MDMDKIRLAIEEVDRTAFAEVVDRLLAARHSRAFCMAG